MTFIGNCSWIQMILNYRLLSNWFFVFSRHTACVSKGYRLYTFALFMLQDFKLQKFMKQSWKNQATIFYKTCVKDLNTFKYDSNIFQFMLTLYHYNRPHVFTESSIVNQVKSNFASRFQYNGNAYEEWGENGITLANTLAKFWLNNLPVGLDLEWQVKLNIGKLTCCLYVVHVVLLCRKT